MLRTEYSASTKNENLAVVINHDAVDTGFTRTLVDAASSIFMHVSDQGPFASTSTTSDIERRLQPDGS